MSEATAASSGVLDGLGPRSWRRPSPRVAVTLAATGSALIVFGVLAESGNRLADSSGDSPNRWPGVVLSAAVLAVSLLVLVRFRNGALAAAGVAGSALSIPPLVFFLTLDYAATPPFSMEAVLLVPTVAWAGLYLFGPAKGHGFYLGAALFGLWLFVMEELEGLGSFPFRIPSLVVAGVDTGDTSGLNEAVPSSTNLGTIAVAFGVVYLVAARVLDRRGRHGIATPFTVAGVVALAAGITLLAGDLQEIGTGLVLLGAGAAVAALGATAERRATTWVGGVGVFWGAGTLAGKVGDGDVDHLALAMVGLGALVVLAGHLCNQQLGEPDADVPGPSTFPGAPPAAAPPPPPPPATPAGPWATMLPPEPPTGPPPPRPSGPQPF